MNQRSCGANPSTSGCLDFLLYEQRGPSQRLMGSQLFESCLAEAALRRGSSVDLSCPHRQAMSAVTVPWRHGVSLSPGKPVFIKVPEDQTGLSGGVASFVCQATGEPKPRITWMKKGKKVSSQRFEVCPRAGGRVGPPVLRSGPTSLLSVPSLGAFPQPEDDPP